MSKENEPNFSNARPKASKSATKRILISYSQPRIPENGPLQAKTPERLKNVHGKEKRIVVIEKLKRATSFEAAVNFNSEERDISCKPARLVKGKLSPSCKKEVFVARKKPQPDQDAEHPLNYVCFSNDVL